MSGALKRDDCWLQDRLAYLWSAYYADAPTGYPIQISFGRPARYRYGSIFNQGPLCRILINGLFAEQALPEYVIDATICHELAHYVHGYASGLPKLHANPHRGGVIDKEMMARGCFHLEEMAAHWRRAHWEAFYAAHARPALAQRAAREAALQARWEAFLTRPACRTREQLKDRLGDLAGRFGLQSPPFHVEWLIASPRRTGLSYRFRGEQCVRMHPALADPQVPDEVIDYELSYWLAVSTAGGRWEQVEGALRGAGLWTRAQKAIRWRRKIWPLFRASRVDALH